MYLARFTRPDVLFAATYLVTEAFPYDIWLRILLEALKFTIGAPIPIYKENTSAILTYNGGGKFPRSKHLLIKQQYIKYLILKGIVESRLLSTLNMPSD
jgi:hypothetical protein